MQLIFLCSDLRELDLFSCCFTKLIGKRMADYINFLSGVPLTNTVACYELRWVEIVASRAPPVLDTLVVMKSTRLKVLTELLEAREPRVSGIASDLG